MIGSFFVFALLVSAIKADANGSEPLSNQTTIIATTTTTTTTIAKEKYVKPSNGSCAMKDEYRCQSNARCIPRSWICDGAEDCPGGSDEVNCTRNHTNDQSKFSVVFYQSMSPTNDSSNCSFHEFSCLYDGKCVNKSWRCDGRNDCGDWSDERYCDDDDDGGKYSSTPSSTSNDSLHHQFLHKDPNVCAMNQFKCLSRNTCIPINLTCDGFNNCGDWSDEKFCGDHLYDNNSTRPSDKRWKRGPCKNESDFKCNSSELCIPMDLKCNKNNDCPDESDEDDCVYSGKRAVIPVESYFQFIYPINGTKPRCNSSTEFHCSQEDICLPVDVVCDGRMDCKDGDDERRCQSTGRPMMSDNIVKEVKDNDQTKPPRRDAKERITEKGLKGDAEKSQKPKVA